jgi:moderate conductance mechanosensitive channel
MNPLDFIYEYLNTNPTMVTTLLTTLAIAVIAYIAHMLLTASVNRVTTAIANRDEQQGKNHPRVKTLRGLVKNIIGTAVWSIAFVMILSKWGVNIVPILTGAGILGLAIGFGSQTLVKDIVTGFFILLENQYNVGDYVEITGVKGRVRRMNLRTTILKDEDGTISIIPNSSIIKVVKYTEEQVEKMKKDKETAEKTATNTKAKK